ncbi:dapper homolog 3-like, partial [Manduca sexta]|uniref:dapper homolog 3-like n=1 Tax=Manduca sexta TaxID=7130 RepID=UPI00188EA56F
ASGGRAQPGRPQQNNANNGNGSPQRDLAADADTPAPAAPAAPAHNISINVTDTDSPDGARRRIHLRSLSDVTPASRAHTPRARSHSERPRASPAPSPARPRAALAPRQARSERSSPDASPLALDDGRRARDRAASALADPWRKMSELDLAAARSTRDPWVRFPPPRADDPPAVEPERRRDPRRPRLERRSPVSCDTCGSESCECWRCTCEPRSARVSPARLAARGAVRALSDEEERPRRLYKSSSQRLVCSATEPDRARPADPLLETTC